MHPSLRQTLILVEELAYDSFVYSFISQTFIKRQQCWAAQPCPGGAQSPGQGPEEVSAVGRQSQPPVGSGPLQSVSKQTCRGESPSSAFGDTFLTPLLGSRVLRLQCWTTAVHSRDNERATVGKPHPRVLHCSLETQLMARPRAPGSALEATAFRNTVQETPDAMGHDTPLGAAVLTAV